MGKKYRAFYFCRDIYVSTQISFTYLSKNSVVTFYIKTQCYTLTMFNCPELFKPGTMQRDFLLSTPFLLY